MDLLFKFSVSWALFLFFFLDKATRIDGLWKFAAEHGYPDMTGDLILIAGIPPLIFAAALLVKTFKKSK